MKKIGLKTFVILLAGIMAGAVLLFLAYCLPVNMGSYYSTERSVELQGYYPNVPVITNTYNTYFQTFLPGVLDNSTVRTFMLPMTFEAGDNPLYLAMNCRGYSYYWHGYVIFTRFLQLFMNYEEIQLANSFLQLALMMLLAVAIGKKKGMKHVIMLISVYALLMPIAVSLCIQYSAVFYIAYAASLILITKQQWFEEGNRLFYFFLIIGMLTSYFDLLTYPLITWGIPMIWLFVMDTRQSSVKEALKKVVILGIAWIIGYGGMWFGKWILATIVLNKNVFLEAINEIIFRTGTDGEVTFSQTNRLYAIYMNWKHYNYKLYVMILLGWLTYWLVYGLLFGWKKIGLEKSLAFLLIGSSSLVWYVVLMNHTEVHHAFTYRIFSISIAAFFAIILESTSRKERKLQNIRHGLCFCATGIVIMVISVVLTMFAREITQIDNKDGDFETRILEEEQLQISFTPEHDKIIAFCVGLKTDSTTGYYELIVSDEGVPLYTETIPVAHYEGDNYKDYGVDWDLEAGKEYKITVNLHDLNKEVHAYYTSEGDLPLDGCQYYEGDSLSMSQPLCGIQYWCLPSSLKTLGLLVLTYFGFLWTVFYVMNLKKD